jgi:hypothetical protein
MQCTNGKMAGRVLGSRADAAAPCSPRTRQTQILNDERIDRWTEKTSLPRHTYPVTNPLRRLGECRP